MSHPLKRTCFEFSRTCSSVSSVNFVKFQKFCKMSDSDLTFCHCSICNGRKRLHFRTTQKHARNDDRRKCSATTTVEVVTESDSDDSEQGGDTGAYFEFADLPLRDDSNRSQGDSVHDDGFLNDSQFSYNHSVSVRQSDEGVFYFS